MADLSKKRILVVDDDAAIRQGVAMALRVFYEVEVAEDAATAFERFDRPPAIDLLIVDVNMPEVTGIDLVKQVRANAKWAKVPVMFLSALDRPADVIAGMSAGARYYMTKPFKIDALLDKVKKILGGR